MPDVSLNRSLRLGLHNLTDLCPQIGKFSVMRRIFGSGYKKAVASQKVRVSRAKMYAFIDDKKGTIVISSNYLKSGNQKHILLDLIHEMVHIRQWREGKDLFDKRFKYVDRPTEIEAYRIAAKEAKKMGLGGRELEKYLKVDWVSKADSDRLLNKLGVK